MSEDVLLQVYQVLKMKAAEHKMYNYNILQMQKNMEVFSEIYSRHKIYYLLNCFVFHKDKSF